MSKQYLTTHTVDKAHPSDIFALAPTPTSLISASGSSNLLVHATNDPAFPIQQVIQNAHPLGCHHLATARGGLGNMAASVGFGGEVKIWRRPEHGKDFELWWALVPTKTDGGDVWSIALSADENYLACTTSDGKIHVWDLAGREKIATYETGSSTGGGSFATTVDLSRDGKLTASGHHSGAVYVFNNNAGRMAYSLSGLAKPVKAVSFSPGCKRLAAAGHAGIIAIYDMEHGEHISNLTVPNANPSWITSLDWNDTGEYLLSGSMDGKVKVWDVARGVCVASHSETESAIWSVCWLPKAGASLPAGMAKGEMFVAGGASRSISFYREATGT